MKVCINFLSVYSGKTTCHILILHEYYIVHIRHAPEHNVGVIGKYIYYKLLQNIDGNLQILIAQSDCQEKL